MKRPYKILVTSILFLGVSAGVALADDSSFLNSLIQGITSKVNAIVAPNVANGSNNVQGQAAQTQQSIQNYNDQYVQDINNSATQFTQNYSSLKTQQLKDLEAQYKTQMDADKSKITSDIQKQIQQEIDKQFEKSKDDILKGIK
jgi:hypothetical protein